MDPLTHVLLTYKLISKQPRVLIAGLGPDTPFYFTYPAWVIVQGKAIPALTTNEWPNPPPWMETLYHALHSLPAALAGAIIVRTLSGRWFCRELTAWILHIVVDIPTHSRRLWAPRFLWPLSDVAVDGVSWAEIATRALSKIIERQGE